MNAIKYLLILLLFFSCSNKQKNNLTTQKAKLTTGIVEYNIKVNPKDPEFFDAVQFGSKARATYNQNYVHFKKLDARDQESFQLVDLNSNMETNYLTFRGDKYALKSSGEMLPKMGELTLKDEKKQILGYTCQKAVAKMGDRNLTAWLTLELGVNFCPYVPSNGFALEYSLDMPFGEVKYIASKVEVKPVDEKLFQPSKEYEPITMEELQAKLMGGPAIKTFEKESELESFDLKNMHGESINLESLKGKVVLINFWFIKCPPCIMEIPDLNELKAEYKNQDVEFIAITFDSQKQVSQFLEKTNFDFDIIPDAQKLIEAYGIQGFPTSVVIDKKGKVVDSKMGGSMNIKEELKAFIEEALTKK